MIVRYVKAIVMINKTAFGGRSNREVNIPTIKGIKNLNCMVDIASIFKTLNTPP
jgi:hypothetical protein